MTQPIVEQHFVSPPHVGDPPHSNPTEDEAKMVKAIEEHFGDANYLLAVSEGSTEMAPLSEREMMFLVSDDTADLTRADDQSKETIVRYV
jgi:hypothetical protein